MVLQPSMGVSPITVIRSHTRTPARAAAPIRLQQPDHRREIGHKPQGIEQLWIRHAAQPICRIGTSTVVAASDPNPRLAMRMTPLSPKRSDKRHGHLLPSPHRPAIDPNDLPVVAKARLGDRTGPLKFSNHGHEVGGARYRQAPVDKRRQHEVGQWAGDGDGHSPPDTELAIGDIAGLISTASLASRSSSMRT